MEKNPWDSGILEHNSKSGRGVAVGLLRLLSSMLILLLIVLKELEAKTLGMPSKKKSSYGRKFAIQGGRGFHQIPSRI